MSDTIKFPLAALEQLCNEIDTSASDEIERLTRERDESKNKLADALQEVDLRTLDFERMKKERDKAREDATNYYAKIGELIDNCKDAQYESEQQARLLGISAERECALRGKIFELERKILQLEAK